MALWLGTWRLRSGRVDLVLLHFYVSGGFLLYRVVGIGNSRGLVNAIVVISRGVRSVGSSRDQRSKPLFG